MQLLKCITAKEIKYHLLTWALPYPSPQFQVSSLEPPVPIPNLKPVTPSFLSLPSNCHSECNEESPSFVSHLSWTPLHHSFIQRQKPVPGFSWLGGLLRLLKSELDYFRALYFYHEGHEGHEGHEDFLLHKLHVLHGDISKSFSDERIQTVFIMAGCLHDLWIVDSDSRREVVLVEGCGYV